MTAAQWERMERRRVREELERKRRLDAALGLLMVAVALLAFALAGTMDCHDRTQGLGASMVPDMAAARE